MRPIAQLAYRSSSGLAAFSAFLALGIALASAVPAEADHGSWTNHEYVITDPVPSSYEGYAHLNASQRYDAGYSRFQLWQGGTLLISVAAECGIVNEGCQYVKTAPRSWSQGGSQKTVVSYHCGHDNTGPHRLAGLNAVHQPCLNWTDQTHHHQSSPFS